MHHQVQQFGNFGLKRLRFYAGIDSRHLLCSRNSQGKSRYSEPRSKIKLIKPGISPKRETAPEGQFARAHTLVSGQSPAHNV
jgi:hypothetical protein